MKFRTISKSRFFFFSELASNVRGLAAVQGPSPRPFRIVVLPKSRNAIVTTRDIIIISKCPDSTTGVGPGGNASSPFGSYRGSCKEGNPLKRHVGTPLPPAGRGNSFLDGGNRVPGTEYASSRARITPPFPGGLLRSGVAVGPRRPHEGP